MNNMINSNNHIIKPSKDYHWMMNQVSPLSEFLAYLAANQGDQQDAERVPALDRLSLKLGVSISKLREQLEVARGLGFVDVRPRTGIRRLPYSFTPAVRQSLLYGIAVNPDLFNAYADLRNQVETSYWYQAVERLQPEDHIALNKLVARAWDNLRGDPVRIPQVEHRQLHLLIYHRLDNPFVIGILEAFWDAYEAVGLNLYTDFSYLEQVWQYHERMVAAICRGDFGAGYQALMEHFSLLRNRPSPKDKRWRFE